MKALYINEKGSDPIYDNLDFQVEVGQIKVKMLASALNHRDIWIVKGQYAGLKYPIVLGSDGAGIYNDRRVLINPSHNWGDDQRFQGPKFKILGLPDHGTMAEYCYVEEKYLYEAPEYLSDNEAAALPLAGLTAYRALFIQGSRQRGQKLLITGIGGGVALFLLQFAVVAGLEVYVTSGDDSKIKKAIELGAIAGFNYNNNLWSKQALETAGAFDLIIDGTGGDGFANLPGIVKPGGKIVNYGGTRGKINNLIPQTIFWKQISIIGSTMGSDKDFREMLDFVTEHKIRPVIDSIHNIEDHKNAVDKMDSGSQFGKIVLKNS